VAHPYARKVHTLERRYRLRYHHAPCVMKIPKAFVSYSHDSPIHKKWVLDLAARLRNSGVDAILDQWELQPGDDLPHFMEKHLAQSDRVLMICTETYVAKANSGSGGVGYEKMIVTADLLKTIDSNKVIPIVRQSGGTAVPTFLRSKLFLDFSRAEQFEFSFDELVRTLHGAPLFKKPPVGNNPLATSVPAPQPSGDALRALMQTMVALFESGTQPYIWYSEIVQRCSMSRILLDIEIQRAIDDGLVVRVSDDLLQLTAKGKHYAIENKLIR
jgi:hypothetical protein